MPTDSREETMRVSNSPNLGPVELLREGIRRLRGTDVEEDPDPLADVSDDALEDAAFEIRQRASYVGWTDEEREAEFVAIADHLLEQQSDSEHE